MVYVHQTVSTHLIICLLDIVTYSFRSTKTNKLRVQVSVKKRASMSTIYLQVYNWPLWRKLRTYIFPCAEAMKGKEQLFGLLLKLLLVCRCITINISNNRIVYHCIDKVSIALLLELKLRFSNKKKSRTEIACIRSKAVPAIHIANQ